MSKITVHEVENLAKLARVGLSEKEKEQLSAQMTGILGFADELNKVDVSMVEPTSQVTGLANVFREDKVIRSEYDREALLANAPETEKGSIKVKKVL
jgi:aspartyl-tRNA(Asn)/glutamyl-tRNA(Gln) amidotransferase subunit C